MTKKLSKDALHHELKKLRDWTLSEEGNALSKDYAFDTFMHAFAFMTEVALYAEKTNHHPEWKNIYNKVHIELSSHDCKGISAKDIALALYMDEVAFRFLNPYMSNQSGLIF